MTKYRKRLERRRAAGLCVNCPEPSVAGKTSCPSCLAKARARSASYDAANRCPCGAPKRKGARSCASCTTARRPQPKPRPTCPCGAPRPQRTSSPLCAACVREAERLRSKGRSLSRYARWRAAGRCGNCGGTPRPGLVTCLTCAERQQRTTRQRYERDPRFAADRALRRSKGITLEQRDAMLLAQGNRCAICQTDDPGKWWCVDHSHHNGKVRAILCAACNSGIGFLRDSATLCVRAAAYLEIHAANDRAGGAPSAGACASNDGSSGKNAAR